jgi:hypothetical protein
LDQGYEKKNTIRTSQTPYRWDNGSYETCPVFEPEIFNDVPVALLAWLAFCDDGRLMFV